MVGLCCNFLYSKNTSIKEEGMTGGGRGEEGLWGEGGERKSSLLTAHIDMNPIMI